MYTEKLCEHLRHVKWNKTTGHYAWPYFTTKHTVKNLPKKKKKICLAVAKAQTLRWPGLCYLIPGTWPLSTSITVENKVSRMGTVKQPEAGTEIGSTGLRLQPQEVAEWHRAGLVLAGGAIAHGKATLTGVYISWSTANGGVKMVVSSIPLVNILMKAGRLHMY